MLKRKRKSNLGVKQAREILLTVSSMTLVWEPDLVSYKKGDDHNECNQFFIGDREPESKSKGQKSSIYEDHPGVVVDGYSDLYHRPNRGDIPGGG